MSFIRTDLISLGGSKPELHEALARLSEAHDILRQHQESFPPEGENPLEHTRKAIAALQKLLKQPAD